MVKVIWAEMKAFLLLNVALAFYNVGTIWAHELDIFPTWRLVGPHFRDVQAAHWRKLPYWVLGPAAAAFAGSMALFWYHPPKSPAWAIAGAFGCQAASLVLTALYWGRWQSALSRDPLGAKSVLLTRILSTHWVRTALISSAAAILLALAIFTP
jgi:hypothetical protein